MDEIIEDVLEYVGGHGFKLGVDDLQRARRLEHIEVAVERDLVADLVFRAVEIRLRIVGQDVLFHIGVDILPERDDLGVGFGFVGLDFPLFQNGASVLVAQRRFDRHLRIAEELVVEHFGLDGEVLFGIEFVGKGGVRPQDQINAFFVQIHPLVTDVLAPLDKALRRVDQLHLAAAFGALVFRDQPDVGGDPCVVEEVGR